MTIFCALTGHRASSDTIFNGGHNFARCTRCRTDLVQQRGQWTTPPKGFRIVWRKGEAAAAGAGAVDDVLELASSLAAAPELPLASEPAVAWLEEAEAEAADTDMPAPLERRRIDRRAPGGSHPNFAGPDRRRQQRRHEFGKRTAGKSSSQS